MTKTKQIQHNRGVKTGGKVCGTSLLTASDKATYRLSSIRSEQLPAVSNQFAVDTP